MTNRLEKHPHHTAPGTLRENKRCLEQEMALSQNGFFLFFDDEEPFDNEQEALRDLHQQESSPSRKNASTPQNELDDLAQGFKKMGNLWAKATWTLNGEERNELTC